MARFLRLWLYFIVGAMLGGVSVLSFAAASGTTLIFNSAGNIVGSVAGTWAGNGSGGGFSWSTVTSAPGGGTMVSANAPIAVNSGRVPVTIPATATRLVTPQNVAKLAVGAARRSIPGLVATTAITAGFGAAGILCDETGCFRASAPSNGGFETQPATLGYAYSQPQTFSCAGQTLAGRGSCVVPSNADYTWTYAADSANGDAAGWGVCDSSPGVYRCTISAGCPVGYQKTANTGDQAQCRSVDQQYTCPSGGNWILDGQTCKRVACPEGEARDAVTGSCQPSGLTDEQAALLAAQVNQSYWGPDIVQQAINASVPVPADPPVVSGPASVTSTPVTTTNTTNNITTTTTTTTTVTNNYAGNTISTNVTNNSVTKNAAGEVVASQQEEVPPEAVSVSDADLPEQPKLYERKFPDGLQGVWTNRIAALKATPLFQLPATFAPTGIGGGSCPAWTFSANIGPHMNFGGGGFAPPCYIWAILKTITIISAMLLARRLIFGG